MQRLDNHLTMSNIGRRYICRVKKKSKPTIQRYRKAKARQRASDGRAEQHSHPPGIRLRDPKEVSGVDTAEDRMGSISRWLEKDKGLIKAQLWV